MKSVVSLLLAATSQAAVLAPANDIVFPSSDNVQNPLQYSGGNTPYFAGEFFRLGWGCCTV